MILWGLKNLYLLPALRSTSLLWRDTAVFSPSGGAFDPLFDKLQWFLCSPMCALKENQILFFSYLTPSPLFLVGGIPIYAGEDRYNWMPWWAHHPPSHPHRHPLASWFSKLQFSEHIIDVLLNWILSMSSVPTRKRASKPETPLRGVENAATPSSPFLCRCQQPGFIPTKPRQPPVAFISPLHSWDIRIKVTVPPSPSLAGSPPTPSPDRALIFHEPGKQ